MNQRTIAIIAFLLFLSAGHTGLQAALKLPAIISEHMVLQQQAEVPIWGWAEPDEELVVTFGEQKLTAKADKDGAWKVVLKDLKAGQTGELNIQGKSETLVIKDVLVGEVWLGSGQSNMAMSVGSSKNFKEEQSNAKLPLIRMFTEKSGASNSAQKEGRGNWVVCSPETVGSFSATLYFFGRELHHKLKVPVGLINSSVGGTPIESWIDPETQLAAPELKAYFKEFSPKEKEPAKAAEKALNEKQVEDLKKAVEEVKTKEVEDLKKTVEEAKGKEEKPSVAPENPALIRARKGGLGGLFLGKISPLIPYRIKGAIWYQGEANTTNDKSKYYQYQLPLLIKDWRAKWGYEFLFAWAQLPNYSAKDRDWPLVREAMLKTLSVPQTGMGINIDIGDSKDIHPKNKQEVGRRLSLWALGTVYQLDVGETSGALPAGHEIQDNKVILKFTHAKKLKTDDSRLEIKGFVIAGENKVWHDATAEIVGETIVVTSKAVTKPVAVRYLWYNDPSVFIRNEAGLPMTPFRTDTWQ